MSQTSSYIMSNLPQSFRSYLFCLGQLLTVLLSVVVSGSGMVLDLSYSWYTMLLLASHCHLGACKSDFFFKDQYLDDQLLVSELGRLKLLYSPKSY